MRLAITLILIIASAFSWVFALSRLSMLNMFKIESIEVVGIDPSVAINLKNTALNVIGGDYLGMFSRSNTFLYPHDRMVAAVLDVSPRVKNVKIVRDGIHNLNIVVNEKKPVAVICTSLPDFSSNNSSNNLFSDDYSSCYFSDVTGYIFMNAETTPSDRYPHYFIPELADSSSSTTSSSVIGTYATSTELFVTLQEFYSKAIEADIPVLAILVKGDGEYEMYAGTSDVDTIVIYFNDSRPLMEELDNLITFWKRMLVETKTDGKSMNFEYIDVRYGSNVFYRKIQ
jgi:hypothetical protein